MKKMGRIVAVALTVVMAVSMAACGASSKTKKIGVVQLVEHPALDASYQGFVDALKEADYIDGENISIDYQNGQGEQANCQTIATQFANDKVDMVLAIATPAAQAAANVIKDIPIMITAITDPADAKLVDSNEKPGGNVTGTSDLTPVKEQMELLKQLVPDVKSVAVMYTSSEPNSVFQANLAHAAAEEMGIETFEATISSTNELQQVVESVIGKADAIYIPTDNAFANAMATVTLITRPEGIPVIVGESGMVDNGGLATVGIDYYKLGYQTGEMAVRILNGEEEPADMPIEYLNEYDFSINTETAEELGIEIPAELAEKNTFGK